MSPIQIVLLIVLAILVAAAVFFILSYRSMFKHANQYTTVGTVEYCSKAKVPLFYQAIIRYTKSGKPYQASTGLIPKWKQPKNGSKGMYTIYHINAGGKKFIQARKAKSTAPTKG